VSTIAAQKQRLIRLLGSFPTAMLVQSHDTAGPLVRPALVASASDAGLVTVAISDRTPEISALETDGEVMLVFQSEDAFAWMRGIAAIEHSREAIDDCWDSRWHAWFPEGPSDPDLCLVGIAATEGEYWDRRASGGLESVLATARALFSGERQANPPPHARIKLAAARRQQAERMRTSRPHRGSGHAVFGGRSSPDSKPPRDAGEPD
jgi:general stress protein 26